MAPLGKLIAVAGHQAADKDLIPLIYDELHLIAHDLTLAETAEELGATRRTVFRGCSLSPLVADPRTGVLRMTRKNRT
jgi:AraC-like DNA-binding protein